MRGFSKPWPPADISPDGQPQRSLADAEQAFLVDLQNAPNRTAFARRAFDGLEKGKLRVAMYREQRSLCVYCERRVEERFPFPPIDHWRPVSRNPELALHWKNLHLSCQPPRLAMGPRVSDRSNGTIPILTCPGQLILNMKRRWDSLAGERCSFGPTRCWIRRCVGRWSLRSTTERMVPEFARQS